MTTRNGLKKWEEMLAMAREARSSGHLPDDAVIYLVDYALEGMKGAIRDRDGLGPELKALDNAIYELERKYGLEEDEFWPVGEAPQDVEALRAKWDAIEERELLAFFRAHGEHFLARLREQDLVAYDRRVENGRQSFFGPLLRQHSTD